jgi:hypothetical protein
VFSPRTKVRLLSRIGAFPSGTVAKVVEINLDGSCVVEFESGTRLSIDCDDLRASERVEQRKATIAENKA